MERIMPISEVYLEDCIEGMKRYADKHFDLAIVLYFKKIIRTFAVWKI